MEEPLMARCYKLRAKVGFGFLNILEVFIVCLLHQFEKSEVVSTTSGLPDELLQCQQFVFSPQCPQLAERKLLVVLMHLRPSEVAPVEDLHAGI